MAPGTGKRPVHPAARARPRDGARDEEVIPRFPFAPHTQRKVYSKGILFPFGGYSSRAVFAVEL